MRIHPLAIAIGMALVGCTVTQPRIKPSDTAGSSHAAVPAESPAVVSVDAPGGYIYELLTPQQTRLLQVFDDAQRTFLTFSDQVPLGLLIFDDSGRAVPFTVSEHIAIVDGVRAGLLVRTPTKVSYAQAPKRAALARVHLVESGAGEGAAWLPAELAAARAEILRAEQRLSGLSFELDKASRGEPSASLKKVRSEIEEIQTVINGVTATLVRAHFATGSALLALSAEARSAILAAATRADEVRIRGGTDNSGPAAVNNVLARARAASMRQLMIDGGIAVNKLHTISAAGDYIASNSTVAGRAQNRRVDVVFANHAQERTPVAHNKSGPEQGGRSSSIER